MSIFFRTPFNFDSLAHSNEHALTCSDPSLAVQSSKDECDINTIVERFGLTGELPSNVSMPVYSDFEQVYDYHTALNLIKAAEGAFMEFPVDVRQRFNHDPQQLIDFVSDDKNRKEAESLGLVVPKSVSPSASASFGVDAGSPSSTPLPSSEKSA